MLHKPYMYRYMQTQDTKHTQITHITQEMRVIA